MMLVNGSSKYLVGDLVAATDAYRIYNCTQEDSGRQCLMQIASAVGHNGDLARASYILRELKLSADEQEKKYKDAGGHEPQMLLNYQLGFPELVDSFVCEDMEHRQANVLAFRSIEEVRSVVPLSNITTKDRLQIDLRTSGWIMGKALKMMVLAHHNSGIAVRLMNGNNILLSPEQHYVIIFDWSRAQLYPGDIPLEERRRDISQTAQAVITVLGSNFRKGAASEDKCVKQYVDYISRLARGVDGDAKRAHKKFYELVDALWKREYYPFTTEPLSD